MLWQTEGDKKVPLEVKQGVKHKEGGQAQISGVSAPVWPLVCRHSCSCCVLLGARAASLLLPRCTCPCYLGTGLLPPGVLSMGRYDDPDSGASSFSFLLGDAPHLDMQYTIFG